MTLGVIERKPALTRYYLSMTEAAKELGISYQGVVYHVLKGTLRVFILPNGVRLVVRADLLNLKRQRDMKRRKRDG